MPLLISADKPVPVLSGTGPVAIDLFAGAGGFTQGAVQAGVQVAWAANHWPKAVQFHGLNHTRTQHACQDLQQANFLDVPRHDILLASPACQGFSRARGKDGPQHDAKRSTAWAVVSCAEVHREDLLVIENVPEFRGWTLYPVWKEALQRLGYALAEYVLDAADFGVPQHRERLFVIGTRSRAALDLTFTPRQHVPVNSVLNWDAYPWSLIDKKGRAADTLARIERGRAEFGECFVAPYYGSGSGLTGRSIWRPLGTLTTRARWSLIRGDQLRMLHSKEARAVMGFPASYQLPGTQAAANEMLGNAVCPPVAEALLRSALRVA